MAVCFPKDHFKSFNLGLFGDNQPQIVYSFPDSSSAKLCSESLFQKMGDKIGGTISTGNHLIVSVSDQNLDEVAKSVGKVSNVAKFHSLITTNPNHSAAFLGPVTSIQKVNNDLYIGQRPQDKDLSFGITRLTDENVNLWWRLHRSDEYSLKRALSKFWNEKWDSSQKRFILKDLNGGALAFRNTLRLYEAFRDKPIQPEIWVSYAVSGENLNPSQPIREEIFPHIEMAMTALTHPDVPMVVHMGISRTAFNLAEIYNKKLPKHENLAIPLHAFTAKAIMSMPQGQNKLWMRTRPTFKMGEILSKSLPENVILKDTENMPTIHHEDGSLTIQDSRGCEVAHFPKEDRLGGRLAFYEHPEMHQMIPLDYAVQYDELAKTFS